MLFGMSMLNTISSSARSALGRLFRQEWHVSWVAYLDNGARLEMDGSFTLSGKHLTPRLIGSLRAAIEEASVDSLEDATNPTVADIVGDWGAVTYVSITNLTRMN